MSLSEELLYGYQSDRSNIFNDLAFYQYHNTGKRKEVTNPPRRTAPDRKKPKNDSEEKKPEKDSGKESSSTDSTEKRKRRDKINYDVDDLTFEKRANIQAPPVPGSIRDNPSGDYSLQSKDELHLNYAAGLFQYDESHPSYLREDPQARLAAAQSYLDHATQGRLRINVDKSFQGDLTTEGIPGHLVAETVSGEPIRYIVHPGSRLSGLSSRRDWLENFYNIIKTPVESEYDVQVRNQPRNIENRRNALQGLSETLDASARVLEMAPLPATQRAAATLNAAGQIFRGGQFSENLINLPMVESAMETIGLNELNEESQAAIRENLVEDGVYDFEGKIIQLSASRGNHTATTQMKMEYDKRMLNGESIENLELRSYNPMSTRQSHYDKKQMLDLPITNYRNRGNISDVPGAIMTTVDAFLPNFGNIPRNEHITTITKEPQMLYTKQENIINNHLGIPDSHKILHNSISSFINGRLAHEMEVQHRMIEALENGQSFTEFMRGQNLYNEHGFHRTQTPFMAQLWEEVNRFRDGLSDERLMSLMEQDDNLAASLENAPITLTPEEFPELHQRFQALNEEVDNTTPTIPEQESKANFDEEKISDGITRAEMSDQLKLLLGEPTQDGLRKAIKAYENRARNKAIVRKLLKKFTPEKAQQLLSEFETGRGARQLDLDVPFGMFYQNAFGDIPINNELKIELMKVGRGVEQRQTQGTAVESKTNVDDGDPRNDPLGDGETKSGDDVDSNETRRTDPDSGRSREEVLESEEAVREGPFTDREANIISDLNPDNHDYLNITENEFLKAKNLSLRYQENTGRRRGGAEDSEYHQGIRGPKARLEFNQKGSRARIEAIREAKIAANLNVQDRQTGEADFAQDLTAGQRALGVTTSFAGMALGLVANKAASKITDELLGPPEDPTRVSAREFERAALSGAISAPLTTPLSKSLSFGRKGLLEMVQGDEGEEISGNFARRIAGNAYQKELGLTASVLSDVPAFAAGAGGGYLAGAGAEKVTEELGGDVETQENVGTLVSNTTGGALTGFLSNLTNSYLGLTASEVSAGAEAFSGGITGLGLGLATIGYERRSRALEIGGGALAGANLGRGAGPIGAAVGAFIGGTLGEIGYEYHKYRDNVDDEEETERVEYLQKQLDRRNDSAGFATLKDKIENFKEVRDQFTFENNDGKRTFKRGYGGQRVVDLFNKYNKELAKEVEDYNTRVGEQDELAIESIMESIDRTRNESRRRRLTGAYLTYGGGHATRFLGTTPQLNFTYQRMSTPTVPYATRSEAVRYYEAYKAKRLRDHLYGHEVHFQGKELPDAEKPDLQKEDDFVLRYGNKTYTQGLSHSELRERARGTSSPGDFIRAYYNQFGLKSLDGKYYKVDISGMTDDELVASQPTVRLLERDSNKKLIPITSTQEGTFNKINIAVGEGKTQTT